MMVESSEKLNIEVSYGELFEMVSALIMRAETFISMTAPKVLTIQTIERAQKFNEILKKGGYDHWTREKFIEMKAKVQNENIQ